MILCWKLFSFSGVLDYIGNRLFTYPDDEMDFYLPQLVNMYIMCPEVAEVIHPYLVFRCRKSADFSLQCAWLLEAYTPATVDSNAKKQRSHAVKLKNLVIYIWMNIVKGHLLLNFLCRPRSRLGCKLFQFFVIWSSKSDNLRKQILPVSANNSILHLQ